MKTIKILILLVSFIPAFSYGESTKILKCRRMMDLMFGQFQQGDDVYTDIYLSKTDKLELAMIDDYNSAAVDLKENDNLRTTLNIDNSSISAEWFDQENQKPVNLVLSYFGSYNWAGMVIFPQGWTSKNFSVSPGAEVEITCKEVDFSRLL